MHNGNATKMREALLRCDAIAQLPETRELQSIKDMRNIISAALAAPPRNCDRFNSGDCNKDVVDASLAWDKFCAEHYPPGTPVVPKTPYSFWSWVFAQANESEVQG